MTNKKRYTIVGLGARAQFFVNALAGAGREHSELVGFCDLSAARMAWYNRQLGEQHSHAPVSTYHANKFEKMLAEQKADVVIVTTTDALHHEYIVRAMEAGCDCIVEKPMTIDALKARAIQDAIARTGRSLQVTFNMRYQPLTAKVRELIAEGAIGKPLAVNFTYRLDTRHGADYFRRWHRDKANSGGLLVHKSTHHFDLVNWLIDSTPEDVFAFGDLKFYGDEAATLRGENYDYDRYTGNSAAHRDPFAMQLDNDDYHRSLYLDGETESGYIRDRNVFSPGITSEDTMAVLARYRNGVIMNYSLIAYTPQEGYELYITGTKGRIEVRVQRPPHVLDKDMQPVQDQTETSAVQVLPMFGEPYEVAIPYVEGGHGGGDAILVGHLFNNGTPIADPLKQRASFREGLSSLALGVAANESINSGQRVVVSELFDLD